MASTGIASLDIKDMVSSAKRFRYRFQVRVMDAPPSTSEAVPVTNEASSDAR